MMRERAFELIPILHLTSCMTSGQPQKLPEPQFLISKIGTMKNVT